MISFLFSYIDHLNVVFLFIIGISDFQLVKCNLKENINLKLTQTPLSLGRLLELSTLVCSPPFYPIMTNRLLTRPWPKFIELLKQKMLLNTFLRSNIKQDHSHRYNVRNISWYKPFLLFITSFYA